MPRPPRDLAAGLFHVYGHSVWAADALFRDAEDCLTYLRELARATARTGCRCVGYCLMKTHPHLILDVDAGALAKAMHYLNFRYATYFNERHGMKGHVYGRRYDVRRIHSPVSLLRVVKYVARNPLEAGLCEKPEDWRFSSYAGTIGLREQDSFVDDSLILGCFESSTAYARAGLRMYVESP